MAEQQQRDTSLAALGQFTFAELERLCSIDAGDQDALRVEVARAQAVEKLVKAHVETINTVLDATRLKSEFMGSSKVNVPKGLIH